MQQERAALRILITSGVRGDTRRYRALHLLEQMRLLGVDATYVHATDTALLKLLGRPWDMVILHRVPYRRQMEGPVASLRKNRVILLSDFDDLIFDPTAFQYINSPDFRDRLRSKDYIATMQQIRGMLAESEGTLASTNYLADQIRGTGKPAWVHRNAFSLEMLKHSDAAREMAYAQHDARRVVVGYASGTPTHNRDFELIRPALMQILARFPQVDLQLIGPLDPGEGWEQFGERIKRLKLVPWRQLPTVLAGLDINLAPLETDNPFAQSKSEIKYMEAGMVGVPTVASPTDAFCYAIRSGQNGFLARTEEEWASAISMLIEDATLRRKTGDAARDAVMTEYHPAVRARNLINQLDEIRQAFRDQFPLRAFPMPENIESTAQQILAHEDWIPKRYEKGPSHIQMGFFSLRTIGLGGTLARVWIFFRRLVAPVFPFRKT